MAYGAGCDLGLSYSKCRGRSRENKGRKEFKGVFYSTYLSLQLYISKIIRAYIYISMSNFSED